MTPTMIGMAGSTARGRRTLRIGALPFLFVALLAVAADASARKPLVIVDDKAYPPFAFLDADGAPRGITVDLWTLWSAKTGIPVEFRLMEWDAALDAVRQGRADLVGGLFRTPKREAGFDFTAPILTIPTGIFFHRDIAGIKGVSDLQGVRVGVVKGDSGEELLRTKHPTVNLAAYPGVDALVRAAVAGEVKVFVADSPVVLFYLAQTPGGEAFRQSVKDAAVNPQYAAVRKGNGELLAVIQTGLSRIPQSDVRAIVAEWAGRPVVTPIPWRVILAALTAILVAAGLVVLWNLQLRRQVARATANLAERHRQLELSQEVVRRSEERLRVTLHSIGDAVIAADRDGVITLINRVAQELTGWSADAAVGRPLGEVMRLLDGRTRQTVELPTVRVSACGQRVRVGDDVILVARDGREYPITDSAAPICDADGVVVGTVMVFRDETERRAAQEQVRRSETLNQALFDQAFHLLGLLDLDGRMFRANPAALKLIGSTAEEVQGRYFADTPWWPDRQEADALLREAMATVSQGGVFSREVRHPAVDGTEHTVHFSLSPLRDSQGRILYYIAEGRDVTETRRAQDALAASERRFRAVFEHAPYTMVINRMSDGMYVDANAAFLRGIGMSKEELTRLSVRELHPMPDEELDWVEATLLRDGFIANHETTVRRKHNAFVPVLFSAVLLEMQGEKHVLSMTVDITERKKAEEALRQKEQRLAAQNESLMALMMNGNVFVSDFHAAVRVIAEVSGHLLGVGRASVWRYTDDYETLQCMDLYEADRERHGGGETLRAADFPIYTQSHRRGKVIAATDVFTDPRTRDIPHTYYREHDIRSLLDVPVWMGDRIRGVLCLESVGQQRVWTSEDERLANIMGALITLAFESAERRQAEEALRASEGKLRSLFSAMTDVILILDADGRYLEIAPTNTSLLYRPAADLLGKTLHEVFPAAQADLFLGIIRKALSAGAPASLEYALEIGGRTIWFDGVVSPLARDRVIFVARDVTERRRAESERDRLTAAVEQSGEILLITDSEGTIEYVNPAFERITGYSRAEVVGRKPNVLKSGQHDAAFYAALWRTISRGETWKGRFVNKRKDGALYTEEAIISPVTDTAGRITHYVAAKRDITEQLVREEQYRQAQRMEAIGQLTGGVAHDFNNLLQVINGYTELALKETAAGQSLHGLLAEVSKAGNRAAKLVQQLLLFSRRQIMRPRALDLNAVVSEMLKMVRRVIGEHIRIEWRPQKDLGAIHADSGMLDQVLMNLCVNARDAMPNGGVLTIQTQAIRMDADFCRSHVWARPGRFALLTVSDTGHGMDKDTLNHVFEPFFTTKGEGKGTGLGLSIAYGIVKQHGGMITAYSEVGRGTVFKVYLPLSEAEAEPHPARAEDAPVHGGETILLAEDDDLVRKLAHRILETAGYTVLLARDGEEAVEVFREHADRIALLLLDVVMPRLGGHGAFQRIRSLNPRIPALFSSGYSEGAIHTDFVLHEGLRLIQKPYSSAALLRAVREALDG